MAEKKLVPTKIEGTVVAQFVQEKTIADTIMNRVTAMEKASGIDLPPNYSYANALRSAYLILQSVETRDKKPVLTACSKESIANTLLDMVIQGLSPAKKQCYFIPYGPNLQLQRSYLGTVAVTKNLSGIKDIYANVIWEGDEFEFTIDPATGLKQVAKHTSKLGNMNITKIQGAYAVIIREDLPPYVEIMTIEQIRKAWNQGAAKGSSGAHINFTDEMAKKTVINRACKLFFNTSNDSDLLVESITRTPSIEEMNDTEYDTVVEEEIKQNANKETLDIKTDSQLSETPKVDEPLKTDPPVNNQDENPTKPGF
ncbi:MAG: recombinase RecT [Candidatus Pacearchaeota archaeon]